MQIPCIYVGDPYQQIYEWRGAVNAMSRIQPQQTAYLTKSFRFCPQIATMATSVLECLNENRPLQGNDRVPFAYNHQGKMTYLCRSNGGVLEKVVALLEEDIKPYIVGGYDDIMRLLFAAEKLQSGQSQTEPEFFGFHSWKEVAEFSQTDAGGELRPVVNLIQRMGIGRLRYILRNTEKTESKAQAVCSTIHRSKGREWDACSIHEDFRDPYKKLLKKMAAGAPSPEEKVGIFSAYKAELRLLYVAITRAKNWTEMPEWVESIFDQYDGPSTSTTSSGDT